MGSKIKSFLYSVSFWLRFPIYWFGKSLTLVYYKEGRRIKKYNPYLMQQFALSYVEMSSIYRAQRHTIESLKDDLRHERRAVADIAMRRDTVKERVRKLELELKNKCTSQKRNLPSWF